MKRMFLSLLFCLSLFSNVFSMEKDFNGQNDSLIEYRLRSRAELSILLAKCTEAQNFNLKNDEGDVSLIIASYLNKIETVKFALRLPDIDINAQDKNGMTSLYIAADKGHLEVVKLLLEGGADINCKNKHGMTPLAVAADRGHYAIVYSLLYRGAKIDIIDNDGGTALQYAVVQGHREVVGLLLKSEQMTLTYLNIGDRWSKNAIYYANDPVIREMLLAKEQELRFKNSVLYR